MKTPHARRVAKGIQFHLHNVCTCIRVWESDLNAAQISSYKGSLMKSLPLLRDRMRGYMHWMAYCWHDLTLVNGYMTHDVTRPTTYNRSCHVDISTCPQQRLYYIMVTLLTRHTQWSCVVLVGSEGSKQMKHTLVIPPPPCTCIALCRPVREMGPHSWTQIIPVWITPK